MRSQTGEADIKFAHWSQRLGASMAADAIDGDFVPIGLLNSGQRTAICRIMVGGEKGVRALEWVDVDLLRAGMSKIMVQTTVPPLFPWRDWQLHCLVALIALTGTDYSRNLPLVKPKRLWTLLPTVLPVLLRCFRLEAPSGEPADPTMPTFMAQLDVAYAVDTLIPVIYRGMFPVHISESCDSFGATLAKLRSSRLADRTKQLLPSESRAACTLKNANFLLLYWTSANPQSMQQGFGFREGTAGNVEWDEV